MADILYTIYEPIFCDCSHGYRINRGCHTALKDFGSVVRKVNDKLFIVEADIQGFFDNINHSQLLSLLKIIIKDKYFLMYVKRFLESGVLIEGKFEHIYKFQPTEKGTPQGGLISPILGNVYLHYVLDCWFETTVKQYDKEARLIRYCDDFIACFNTESSAHKFFSEVQSRFKIFRSGN